MSTRWALRFATPAWSRSPRRGPSCCERVDGRAAVRHNRPVTDIGGNIEGGRAAVEALEDVGPERRASGRSRRRRGRFALSIAGIGGLVLMLSGCYSVDPLPYGTVTNIFSTKHPQTSGCRYPSVVLPIPDCCRELGLPNGQIRELPTTRLGTGWFPYKNSENRYEAVYPFEIGYWYENAWAVEDKIPGCYNEQDVFYYVQNQPVYKYWRMSHNVETGGWTVLLLDQGTGHRWNP